MSDLAHTKVMILIFAMPGCPACHSYLPKLTKQMKGWQKLGHPFVDYENGMTIERGSIPVVTLDVTSQDPSVQSLANQYKIENLPTTVLLPRNGLPARYEGALSDQDIYNLLTVAVETNR